MGILSGIAGVLSGVGGALITNIFNLFTTKQKNKHELDMIKARIDEMKAESELHIKEITVQGEINQEIASQASFDLSQKYGNQRLIDSPMIIKLFDSRWSRWAGVFLVMLMAIVDVISTAMRPAITLVLMYITAAITYQHIMIMDENKTLVTAEMIVMIIDSIIYLTFTVVGWWFGDRTISKFVQGKRK